MNHPKQDQSTSQHSDNTKPAQSDAERSSQADLSVLVDEVFGESRTNGVIITTGGGGNG